MTNHTEVETPVVEEKKPSPSESFQQIRKMLEQQKQENENLKAELEQERKRAASKYTNSESEDEDDNDEPYVDNRTLKRKLGSFEQRLSSVIESKAEEKARALIEEERKATYLKQNSDFEQVMSPEVVQQFADRFPGMAEAILKMPDSFERQKLVYESIKNTGILKKEEKSGIQDKINQNRHSPYYQPSGVGTAPYAGAGDFSSVGQKNAYQKMKELQNRLRLG